MYPQSLEVLDQLAAAGWQHILLSNHVPELPDLLDALQVRSRFRAVFNSATTGFEKPHPEAFRLARAAASPGHRLLMIGDNGQADAAGAVRCGIDAIWVRRDRPADTPDLVSAARILLSRAHTPSDRSPTTHEVPPLPISAPATVPVR
ncbi:HAD family hydrolase [Streptomyces sp. NPDC087440]|uniref:HAD family hydrolase n=1 Tax=Streptomyces sp. NPDC087440 TaxID=3365790 RepID=UPI003823ACE7